MLTFLFVQFGLDGLSAGENEGSDYYNLAVKKYINNDLDGALLELDKYSGGDAILDTRSDLLRSLIINRKQKPLAEKGPAEEIDKANEYFRIAFKKYIEGNFAEASAYLEKSLALCPDFKKAERFRQVVEKRQEGSTEEDMAFIEQLLNEMDAEGALPKEKAADKVSVDFKDEDISNILRVLSQLYGVNIVAGNDINARITVSLVDVTLEEALDSILNTAGYSYVKEGSVIRVVDKNTYVTTMIFKLKNISLVNEQISTDTASSSSEEDIIKQLKDMLSDKGKLLYDNTLKTLMVTDTLVSLDNISSLISDMDVFQPQVLIEAKIIELSPKYNDYVGIDWSVLEGYTVAIETPKGTYEHGEDRSSKPSVDWKDTAADTGDTYTHERKLEQEVTYTLKKTLTGSLSAENFQLVLSALQSDTDATLISSPNVLTKSGREAYITIGEQYPIPSYSYNEDTGGLEVSGFEYKDIGVVLTVIPYPVEDGYVSIIAVPEVSKSSGTATFGGTGGAQIPVISITKVKTQALVKSGHTLAIGGLVKEESTTTVKKVPILGDILFIKNAFRHTSTSITKKNLIIFITPTIITKENMDMVTSLQSRKLADAKYEIKTQETERKGPKPGWGGGYKQKKTHKD